MTERFLESSLNRHIGGCPRLADSASYTKDGRCVGDEAEMTKKSLREDGVGIAGTRALCLGQ
jgi:hypothetical protein